MLGPLCFHEDLIVHQVQAADGALHHGLQTHDVREVDLAVLGPDGGDIFTDLFPPFSGDFINGGEAHPSALPQRGESGGQGIVALIIALQRLAQPVGSGSLSHVLQLVADLVELLGMVPVVLQHILHERLRLLDALKAAGMLMGVAVGMGMVVAVIMGMRVLMDAVGIVHVTFLLLGTW